MVNFILGLIIGFILCLILFSILAYRFYLKKIKSNKLELKDIFVNSNFNFNDKDFMN